MSAVIITMTHPRQGRVTRTFRVLNDPSSTNLFILVYSVLLYFNANQHDLWKKKEKP